MPSSAKERFLEQCSHLGWSYPKKERWPLLQQLLNRGLLTYLDLTMAQRWLPEGSESVALFLCHLILAAKDGHLCVECSDAALEPSVRMLWQGTENEVLSESEVALLTTEIIKGRAALPALTEICHEDGRYYLQKYRVIETMICEGLLDHMRHPPSLRMDLEQVQEELEKQKASKSLLPEQCSAIMQACQHSLSLISGGPGTGKTYTAAWLIRLFWQNLTDEQKANCKILVTAPTGKAASNLQNSLNKTLGKMEQAPKLQAQTLHAALGVWGASTSFEDLRHLSADLIVVDESSMIDGKMMAFLFRAVKRGARLVLLGDQHQLPSVEAGGIFADLLLWYASDPARAVPCTQLQVCMRAELQSLNALATAIKIGDDKAAYSLLTGQSKELTLDSLPSEQESQRFFEYLLRHFPSLEDGEEALRCFNTIRILSPLRQGPFGFEAVNASLASLALEKARQRWLAVPILITANDHRQDLFNGETGIWMRKLSGTPLKDDFALFPSRQQGEVRRFPLLMLPKYETAYCLSVHKSQGSEFERVLVLLPERSERFGREILYTAVTRARRKVDLFGNDTVLQQIIAQKGTRLSGLPQRLVQGSLP